MGCFIIYLFDRRQNRRKGEVKVLDLSDPPEAHTDVEYSTSQQQSILAPAKGEGQGVELDNEQIIINRGIPLLQQCTHGVDGTSAEMGA